MSRIGLTILSIYKVRINIDKNSVMGVQYVSDFDRHDAFESWHFFAQFSINTNLVNKARELLDHWVISLCQSSASAREVNAMPHTASLLMLHNAYPHQSKYLLNHKAFDDDEDCGSSLVFHHHKYGITLAFLCRLLTCFLRPFPQSSVTQTNATPCLSLRHMRSYLVQCPPCCPGGFRHCPA